MRSDLKRVFTLLMALIMVIFLLPMPQKAQAVELPSQAYVAADSLFEHDTMENHMAKRNPFQSQMTDAAEKIVMESDS